MRDGQRSLMEIIRHLVWELRRKWGRLTLQQACGGQLIFLSLLINEAPFLYIPFTLMLLRGLKWPLLCCRS